MVRRRTCYVLLACAVIVNGYPQDNLCQNVRQSFINMNLVPESDIPLSALKGSSNGYCESSESCCTEKMEEDLVSYSERDFRLALQASSASFRETLATAGDFIQSELARSIRQATNKTQTMFSHLYEQVAGIAREPIELFFADLERSLIGDASSPGTSDVDVESIVLRFFDDLYPRIYSQSQNGAIVGSTDEQKEFTDSFALCMKGAMSEIRPFGEMPKRIAGTVTQSLEAAREFISAFRISSEVLDVTHNLTFSPECRASLFKSSYCAQCAGVSSGTVKWCRGLCMNVARGCLAQLADADKSWNEVMDVLAKIVSGVEGGQVNLVDVMNSLDSRLSEAVLYALESGVMFDHKIKSICGVQEFKPNSSKIVKPVPPPPSTEVKEENVNTLHIFLQTVLAAVTEAKGYYANVADNICSSKNTLMPPSDEDTNCWNGSQVGEYTKTIGGIGLSEQKYNPEVRILSTNSDPVIEEMSQRLHLARQMLASKLIIPADLDSLVLSDQGSGSGYGDDDVINDRNTDIDNSYRTEEPDDSLDGSGSGDGEGESGDKIAPEENGTTKPGTRDGIDFEREQTTKKPQSGGSTVALSLTLLLVTILTASRRDL